MSRTERTKTALRIPSLTDEMRASFPRYVDEWTSIGRSTDPTDRGAARTAVAAAYGAAGLAAPRIVWAVSPIGGALTRHLLRDGVCDGAGAGVWDGVWAGVEAGVAAVVEVGVRAGVEAGVWAGVEAGVWDGVRAGVRDGVRAGVLDGVWAGVEAGVAAVVEVGVRAGVEAGVWAGVEAGVWDGVGDGVGDVRPFDDVHYNHHEAGWLSFYAWFADHGLSDIVAPMDGLLALAKSAGWVWFHRDICIVSDRPATLHDERVAGTTHRRRLHNPTGPSVTYRDGWALWHWHGQLVPQWAIESPDPRELIAQEKNTEIRRAAIERWGWDRYLDAIGAAPISTQPDPGNPGHVLRLFDLPRDHQVYDAPVRLLVMDNASRDRDGTRRRYAETVPVDIDDAITAAAWQFGVDRTVYAQLERAT